MVSGEITKSVGKLRIYGLSFHKHKAVAIKVEEARFGKTSEGEDVFLYSLRNDSGMQVSISNYGGIITSITVPDKQGKSSEVVLGFDRLDDYLKKHPYLGATVGRVANRISGATFKIKDETYQLNKNEGDNHLHGGLRALDKVAWTSEIIENEQTASVHLSYLSEDGEEHYPGNLHCQVIFTLFEENILEIEYKAKTDKTTLVNFTHHDYFNLKDGGATPVFGHELMINAETYTPTKPDNCVTGEIKHVNESDFDFRQFNLLGEKISKRDQSSGPGKGFDHNFILSHMEDNFGLAAILREAETGRQLIIKTTQPCLQLYTGTYLDGSLSRNGMPFHAYHGVCLECQSYPDAVNQAQFPDILLHPGEVYNHKTSYRFSVYS